MNHIQNIKAFEESHKSFNFLNPEVQGCDLDYCYEKNGQVLILEGKMAINGIFYLKWAQWKMLQTLKNLLRREGNIYYVINDKDRYWIEEINSDNFRTSGGHVGSGFFRYKDKGLCKKIDLSNVKWYTKEEIKQKILNITNTFTKI